MTEAERFNPARRPIPMEEFLKVVADPSLGFRGTSRLFRTKSSPRHLIGMHSPKSAKKDTARGRAGGPDAAMASPGGSPQTVRTAKRKPEASPSPGSSPHTLARHPAMHAAHTPDTPAPDVKRVRRQVVIMTQRNSVYDLKVINFNYWTHARSCSPFFNTFFSFLLCLPE